MIVCCYQSKHNCSISFVTNTLFIYYYQVRTSSHLASLLAADSAVDDTDSDSLSHITDGETAERRILREGLDAQRLGGDQLSHHGLSVLDEIGVLTEDLSGTLVNLSHDLLELAGNMGSVAIQHRAVTRADTRGVVHDDDLGLEGLSLGGRIVLGVSAHVSTVDILDGNVLHVETDVISGHGLGDGLVVHLHRLDLGGHTHGGEHHGHTGLQHTSLHTTDGDSTDTANLVHILQGQTERLVHRSLGRLDGVQSLNQSGSLVPGHVGRALQHVISVETRDGNEGNTLLHLLITDLTQEGGHLGLDLSVTSLAVVHRLVVHLVDAHNHLLHSQSVGQQSVLTGLTVLGVSSLELSSTGGNDEDGNISLRGSGNHVLDEITVTGGINDGEEVLLSLELPQGNIDGDTTLTLGLHLIQHPGVLEGALTNIVGLLLKTLNGTLINTSAGVDKVSGGGGLSRIDVANNDQVNMRLFLGHDYI